MGSLFFPTREITEGAWLYFKDSLKQEQNLIYQGDTFELDSVQHIFIYDQDIKPNMFTIVKFSNRTNSKIVNAGNSSI